MAREKFINGKTNYQAWRETRANNSKYDARAAVIAETMEKDTLTDVDYIRLVNTIMISEMTGKLSGFYSISTSVLMNERCQARAGIPGTICEKCYAAASLNHYDGLMEAMETNHKILNTWLIPENAWRALACPSTNGKFRIEAFGDVATVTCARNYVRIINTHKWLHFGVWTKNPDLWEKAFELEGGKPENMTYIVSSIFLNKPYVISEKQRGIVDHVFTVYDIPTIKEKHIDINCGARDCNGCRRCYGSSKDIELGYSFHVREKLK